MVANYCSSCGTRLKDGARFCSKCGAATSDTAEKSLAISSSIPSTLPPSPALPATNICVVCGIELTRKTRKDKKTQMCYRCYVAQQQEAHYRAQQQLVQQHPAIGMLMQANISGREREKLIKESIWVLDQVKGYFEAGEQANIILSGLYSTKAAVVGSDTVRTGYLIATDKKVIFYGKRVTGQHLEVFQYFTISAIGMRKIGAYYSVALDAYGSTLALRQIHTAIAESFIRYVQDMMRQAHLPPRTAAPIGQVNIDVAAQIHQLGELRDQGLLTEAEFQKKKEELLAKM